MNMVIFGLLMDKLKKFLILIKKMILNNLIKNIIQIILHELQQDYLNHQHSFNVRNIDKSDRDQTNVLFEIQPVKTLFDFYHE
jgi:hypothetical protein